MPVPSHVARKLRDLLGNEAGEDLVTWMDESSAVRADVAELRQEMQVGLARMAATLAKYAERGTVQLERLRGEFSAQIERTKTELGGPIDHHWTELTGQVERNKTELTGYIAHNTAELGVQIERSRGDLTAQIERSKADLMKWPFVFCVGAVTAIAALAGVLRG